MRPATSDAHRRPLDSATSHPRAAATRGLVVALAALAALCAVCTPANVAAATPFVHETVDAPQLVGEYTSLAIDARGNPRITYYNDTDGRLRYAVRTGASWTTEWAISGAGGFYSSLALDAQGNAHVSSYDVLTDDLEYHTRIGATWASETVDAPGNVGHYTSIALTAQGNPRIAYVDLTNSDVKFAAKTGGAWTVEIIDVTGCCTTSSIAIDAQGNPHVSYYSNTAGDLRYAVRIASAWIIETVDAPDLVGLYSSLALDAQGNPRISYHDNSNDDLVFASKNGGAWTIQVVDSAGSVGEYTSLALDAQGNPRISYYDATNEDLKFATRGGSSWSIETVDATGAVGRHTSLALDAQGNPVISYYDSDGNDLKLSSAAVRVVGPSGGATWAVGSLQEIRWAGAGTVDVSLSVDGGRSFELLRNDYIENVFAVRVPHAPTRFAQIRVQRANPLSTAFSDSFFTIDAAIALAKFDARVIGADAATAVALAWETAPGPEAEIRYRVERAVGADAGFAPIHAGAIAEREAVDRGDGATGAARYRLVAVNGLGEEYLLGETRASGALRDGAALSAYPNPARGGSTSILYRVPFGGRVALDVYDASGRRVRSLAAGDFAEGVRSAAWDGRDDAGRDVAAGAYWLRLASPSGFAATERVTVIR